jgi:hypothetical protein
MKMVDMKFLKSISENLEKLEGVTESDTKSFQRRKFRSGNESKTYLNTNESRLPARGVRRGVFREVEDSRRPPALQVGHR